VTVRADDLTLTHLLKQARVRAAFGDQIRDGCLFDATLAKEYLKLYALQNQKKNAARTYVATRGNRVVGYYTSDSLSRRITTARARRLESLTTR
jgi:hypothetical protein